MIRSARCQDAAEIHALLWSVKDDIPITNPAFEGDAGLEKVEQWCGAGLVLVDECGGTIAGVAVVDREFGITLSYLAVSSEYRNKGVASALIAQVRRDNGAQVRVQVHFDNTAMQDAMEKRGFEIDRDSNWIYYRLI